MLTHNRHPKASELSILILTDWPINLAHGTGACLIRLLDGYNPAAISNCFLEKCRRGEPYYENSYGYKAQADEDVMRNILAPPPDIVYSMISTIDGLNMLKYIADRMSPRVPIVQHFVDMYPGHAATADIYWKHLKDLQSRISEFWTLTGSIKKSLAQYVGIEAKYAPYFSTIARSAPEATIRKRSFTGVMTGNIWSPQMADITANIWNRAMTEIPLLKPIKWFCHPNSLSRLGKYANCLSPSIQQAGFFSDYRQLLDAVADADLAILPFHDPPQQATGSKREEIASDYSKYSLPSRLVDYCACGLPVFAIATVQTETAKFIRSHGIGRTASTADGDCLLEELIGYIKDKDARAEAAKTAWSLAQREFNQSSNLHKILMEFTRLKSERLT